jgi:tRNA (adenine57-N1/adenine58-N1)-methyltransferase catalytic subunit
MYETLLRPHEVSYMPKPLSIAEARESLKVAEVRKEEKRQKQIAGARAKAAQAKEQGAKRKRSESSPGKTDGEKRTKKDGELEDVMDVDGAVAPTLGSIMGPSPAPLHATVDIPAPVTASLARAAPPPPAEKPKMAVSRVFAEVRGHTSYLTFACLAPAPASAGVPGSSQAAAATAEENEAGVVLDAPEGNAGSSGAADSMPAAAGEDRNGEQPPPANSEVGEGEEEEEGTAADRPSGPGRSAQPM